MDKASVGDIEIAYSLAGEGPPLVMIMGLFTNADWWEPELIEALAEHYRVLVFDNRGSGRSGSGGEAFTMRRFADDVAGLMDALGIDRGHVFGVSMGGMIAQQFVLDHPEKVDRLALGCTMCGFSHAHLHLMKIADRLAGDPLHEEAYIRKVAGLLFPPEWIEAHPEAFETLEERAKLNPIPPVNAAKQLLAVLHFSARDRLHEVRSATRVTCGSEDVLIPPENSNEIAERIPDARLRVFDGGGHGYFVQYRDELASDLVEFFG
ncbi:MAG: alpha/beta hydrolase [Actinomycetota bacterium]